MYGNLALRRLGALTISTALAVGLAGCTAEEPPERIDALSVVVGARSNMPESNLRGVAIERAESAAHWGARFSVVVADGDPFQFIEPEELAVRHENDQVEKRDREHNLRKIAADVAGARAKESETDLLGAIRLAARGMKNIEGRRTIIVLDSGLSTAGSLNFLQPGLLDAEASGLAALLDEAEVLPALSGIEVILQGIGDTTEPQADVGQRQRNNLFDIWKTVLSVAGADDVRVEETRIENEALADVPSVTTVPVREDIPCRVESIDLNEGDVSFRADSADFLDSKAARDALRPIAHRMIRDDLEATLAGTTADVGDREGQRRLSQQRAEAVMAELVKLEVPSVRMTAVGLGSDFPQYVQDHDINGELIPEAAAANRKVTVRLAGAGDLNCE